VYYPELIFAEAHEPTAQPFKGSFTSLIGVDGNMLSSMTSPCLVSTAVSQSYRDVPVSNLDSNGEYPD